MLHQEDISTLKRGKKTEKQPVKPRLMLMELESQEKGEENGVKAISEEIMAETLPKLIKEIKPQIQDVTNLTFG